MKSGVTPFPRLVDFILGRAKGATRGRSAPGVTRRRAPKVIFWPAMGVSYSGRHGQLSTDDAFKGDVNLL